jgi:hypothetical protein
MTSKIKVDNINKVSDDSNIIKKCGTTITLGASGDSIALASGASQTGFGRTGTVDWQTGSIKTATFTAANGEGYFANTSGGAFTMNLPAGTAGNIVSVVDYTNTFQNNNLTVSPNGSQKIGGIADDATLSTEGQSVTLVYVDDTEGWKNIQDSTSNVTGAAFICASVSGACNTLTTVDTNFKVAIFKGPGTFTVNTAATCASNNVVDYLVVAGGASGGKGSSAGAGGGGAGGVRVSPGTSTGCWTASPLGASPAAALPVSATGYPITVGAGGATMPCNGNNGNPGSNSVFAGSSTITSAGGGGGSGHCQAADSGGSGGGGNPISPTVRPLGAGNTPPVNPPQGNAGGTGSPPGCGYPSAGGGGALAVGADASSPNNNPGAAGGAGAQINICGNNYFWGGGGAGSGWTGYNGGNGGTGGGGGGAGQNSGGTGSTTGINNAVNGSTPGQGTGGAGGANTGGGGGGANSSGPGPTATSGAGGSGIVIIRYKFQ